MPVTCARCGRESDRDNKFCDGCGAFLGWESQQSAESQLLDRPVQRPADQRAGVQIQIKNDLIQVVPGSAESTTCTVKNLGTQVEQFRFSMSGPEWLVVEPATLSVYPGQEATGSIQAAPPRTPGSAAGVTPFLLTVTSALHAGVSSSVAGRIDVAPFYELGTELVPTTSNGRGWTRHHITLDNRGNVSLRVPLNPTDVADGLRLDVPATAEVAPGAVTEVPLAVHGRRRWFGRPEPKTFSVVATAPKPLPPTRLSGTRIVVPWFPHWVPAAATALVVAGVAGALLIPKLTAHKPPLLTSSSTSPSVTPSNSSGSASSSPSTSPSISPSSTPSLPPPYDLTMDVSSATWTSISIGGHLATSVQQDTGCQGGGSSVEGAVFSLMQAVLQDGTTVPTALETVPPGHESSSIYGAYTLPSPTVAGEVFRANLGFCQGVGAGSLEQYRVFIGNSQIASEQQLATGTLDSNTDSMTPVDLTLPAGTTQIDLDVMNVVGSQTEGNVVWVGPIVEAASAASSSP
jgi:hypothetical protein